MFPFRKPPAPEPTPVVVPDYDANVMTAFGFMRCSLATEREYADANPESPIEDALGRIYEKQERLEKSLAVLTDRLEPITQPAEPTDTLTAMSGEKSSVPRSRVTARLMQTADDLQRIAARIDYLASRLDI